MKNVGKMYKMLVTKEQAWGGVHKGHTRATPLRLAARVDRRAPRSKKGGISRQERGFWCEGRGSNCMLLHKTSHKIG